MKHALISVYHKEGLETLVSELHKQGVVLYSTGGTAEYIASLGIPVELVEELTGYPSIFGGRVKTLHPSVFGGILYRRSEEQDIAQASEFSIPSFDMVVVDLYPFKETLLSGATEQEVIEKIDIGGVSLLRAAAKNFTDVAVVSRPQDYAHVAQWVREGSLDLNRRKALAAQAFNLTFEYDLMISAFMNGGGVMPLRYGENPHQNASFVGNINKLVTTLQGKALSYNNLLDLDAALQLISEFDPNQGCTFAIIKHNNACGVATRKQVKDSYLTALASDPLSAFGGILVCNHEIDFETAQEIDSLFFEILIAPSFAEEALALFKSKKQRTLLKLNSLELSSTQYRSALNGWLIQDADNQIEKQADFKVVTEKKPTESEVKDLEMALKIVKHTKSNAIVLVKGGAMLASGTGQTSRVDALNQSLAKARHFGMEVAGAVMASDAFFPFPDCVEIAAEARITAIVQPGGSIKDALSIEAANQKEVSMVFSGNRHFKH